MGRAKAIIFAALLAVPLGFAQDDGIGATTQGGRPVRNGADQSVNIQGCLSSSALGDNAFSLTQDQTGTVYRLTENTSDLTSHVGHEIVVTGSMATLSQSPRSNAGVTSSAASAEPSTIQVSGVEMISDHCADSGTALPSVKLNDNRSQTTDFGPGTKIALRAPPQPETQPKAGDDGTLPAKASPTLRSDSNLPQTATILPLLGLVGLSSLVTGFIFRVR